MAYRASQARSPFLLRSTGVFPRPYFIHAIDFIRRSTVLNRGVDWMLTIFIRGLARSTTESSLTDLFTPFGSVHSVRLVKDMFTGQCKGIGEVKMEGHEARSAISALNHREVDGSSLRLEISRGRKPQGKGR